HARTGRRRRALEARRSQDRHPVWPVSGPRRRRGALHAAAGGSLELGTARLRCPTPERSERPLPPAEVRMVRMHGASLLELLVCPVRLATLASTGALRLPEILAGVRLSGTVHRLSAALRQARGRALERGGPVEIVVDEVAGVWEMRDSNGSPLER